VAANLPSAAPGSDRVRLATLALHAACSVDGVLTGEAGPSGLLVTSVPGGDRLDGVQAVAEPDGRYSVEVGLRARLVPLPALAAAVRARITQAATAAGLESQLGPVSVAFFALDHPGPLT
jgi:hypothetical protein